MDKVLAYLKLKSLDELFSDEDEVNELNMDTSERATKEDSWLEDGNDKSIVEVCHKELLFDGMDETVMAICEAEESKQENTHRRQLIKNTPEEIKRNRLIALIRRHDSINKGGFMRDILKDMFFPIETWPTFIIEVLLTSDFRYQERLCLATFFHGNGIKDASFAINIIKWYNNNFNCYQLWRQRFYLFEALWKYLDKAEDESDPECYRIKTTYYFYSMIAEHMMYYDGIHLRKKGGTRVVYEYNG